jgi:hypothetical protein
MSRAMYGRKIMKIARRFIKNDTSENWVFQERNFATGSEISERHISQILRKLFLCSPSIRDQFLKI